MKGKRLFSSTLYKDRHGHFYILDNAGSIMPAVSDRTYTSLFCFTCKLRENVDKEKLQLALNKTISRYKYLYCKLKKGLFWYYLEEIEDMPQIEDDVEPICTNYSIFSSPLFRVRAKEKRINVEFSHALTDGTGAIEFLKTLLYEYFNILGYNLPSTNIITASTPIDSEEYEDGYKKYYEKNLPKPDPLPIAFHIPGKLLPEYNYRVIFGYCKVDNVLKIAKSKNLSLTEFLTAIYIYSLQQIYFSINEKERKKYSPYINFETPVNLRKIHPSKTMRNFSLFALTKIDCRMGMYSLDEIFELTKLQIQAEIKKKEHLKMIKRNVASEYIFALRLVPLFLKVLILRSAFYYLGDGLVSGFLSNIGQINIDPEYFRFIEHFDFIPAPGKASKTNCSVVSFNNKLSIAFGSRIENTELERLFFSTLVSLGVEVEITTSL
ncbi:MAG: hypothetical protein ACK4YF_00300 [Exilispira sp.]